MLAPVGLAFAENCDAVLANARNPCILLPMNYEVIAEQIDTANGLAVRILKFAADKFHVVSRDEDAGQTIGVVICKTEAKARDKMAEAFAPAPITLRI